MGKARNAPVKFVSIPRLELQAAVLATRVCKMLLLGHVCWKVCPTPPFKVGLEGFVPWISNIERGRGDILQHNKSQLVATLKLTTDWDDFKTVSGQ